VELQAERLIGAAGCLAYAQYAFEQDAPVRPRAAHLRSAAGPAPGHPAQVRRHGHPAGGRPRADLPDRPLVRQGRLPGAGDLHEQAAGHPRTAWQVADQCVQIHGGAGYMDEYDVSRVLRDIRLYRIGAGADEIMLDVIGKSYGF